HDVTILNRESGNAYNFFYWKEDGTPIKIGSSGSDGKSFEADDNKFPMGYYDLLPQSECPDVCGYYCKRCKLRRKEKLVTKCSECQLMRNEGYTKCDACVVSGSKYQCFNCKE
ncbi:unnamed protein product, partial [Owenia fusiformis]